MNSADDSVDIVFAVCVYVCACLSACMWACVHVYAFEFECVFVWANMPGLICFLRLAPASLAAMQQRSWKKSINPTFNLLFDF